MMDRIGDAVPTDRLTALLTRAEDEAAETDRGVGEAIIGPPGMRGRLKTAMGTETGLTATVVQGAPGTDCFYNDSRQR
jgi:hypothetical protein